MLTRTTLLSVFTPITDDWGEEAFDDFVSGDVNNVDASDTLEVPGQALEAIAKLVRQTVPQDQPCSENMPVGQRVTSTDKVGEAVQKQVRLSLPPLGKIANPEIVEAYLLDAQRGVTSMEQAVIEFESGCDAEASLNQICRELHTLKGASAIAGLDELARYLHDVEEVVQQRDSRGRLAEITLPCVDVLRRQMDALLPDGEFSSDSKPALNVSERIQSRTGPNDSISVKASQLDRLMDMLAELVMLRNQRECRVSQLREINEELGRCGSRLREVESHLLTSHSFNDADTMTHSNPLREVANDIGELRRSLRDSFEPVAAENIAVSSFIRQFRKALVALLRMPVSGLFQRLQRAALDAARVEGKQVRFELIGAETGLERSVQERLFEPLLHLVRNAVSHGIESPADRAAAGKDKVGTVTLEASSTPNMLEVTVREDGRGLDYESIRRRAIEMGIIMPDGSTNPKDLAQLMFRPGFSTRIVANEIAGRGVGLDVVAYVLQEMNGWVEVESKPGHGAAVRLSVPLRSIIEYAMVIRSGDQLLAIPMGYVRSASEQPTHQRIGHRSSLRQLLGRTDRDVPETASVVVDSQPQFDESRPTKSGSTLVTQNADNCVELMVEEILGPEEVVVRPLPPLLRHQLLFAGVTLSGGGHVVLALDPTRLLELSNKSRGKDRIPVASPSEKLGVILVVDDSLSSRKHVALLLQQRGWDTVEAADGMSALDRLEPNSFDAVMTDYEMPRMDGLQLIHSIRLQSRLTGLPIVMVSSLPPEAMKERALAEGANLYFQKPIESDALEDILGRLKTLRRNTNEYQNDTSHRRQFDDKASD